MRKGLKPDLFVRRISDIPPDYLDRHGIRGVIIDLDNTIAPWDSEHLTDPYDAWLREKIQQKIPLILVSNSGEPRVRGFAEKLGVPYIHSASKPFRRAFLKAMEQLGTAREETVVIGDQIFTDVLGGNRLGLRTILVEPMAPKEYAGTKVLRALERLIVGRKVTREGFDRK